MDRKPPPAPVLEEVARRVRDARPGTVFTPSRFDALGDRAAVNKSLQTLVEQDALRRLARGVFDKPRRHPDQGALWPTIGDIVEALTVGEGLCLLPTGDYAAKLFGPRDRLPDQVEFLSIAPGRSFDAGPIRIVIKQVPARQLAAARVASHFFMTTLRSVDPAHVDSMPLASIRRTP
jgi:hypothetical protein